MIILLLPFVLSISGKSAHHKIKHDAAGHHNSTGNHNAAQGEHISAVGKRFVAEPDDDWMSTNEHANKCVKV